MEMGKEVKYSTIENNIYKRNIWDWTDSIVDNIQNKPKNVYLLYIFKSSSTCTINIVDHSDFLSLLLCL